jgi:hypothetical protein
MAEAPEKVGAIASDASTISWTAVPYTRLYIVFRDGNVKAYTTEPSYTDANATVGTSYSYTVQAVGEFGALSPMSEAKSVTIEAAKLTLTTSVNIAAAGSVAKTPEAASYAPNTAVSLQATANAGYKFVKWTTGADVALSTTNPYSVTLTENTTVKAVFELIPTAIEGVNAQTYIYTQAQSMYVKGVETGSQIAIYNLAGRQFTTRIATSDTESFSLEMGTYLVRITKNNKLITLKAIIK